MKIPPYKIKKKTHSLKPLIFPGRERLQTPKIPLRLFVNVHEPNLYEFSEIIVRQ
jgi:hypothetical protein